MADLRYTVEIDTLAAQRSLSSLSNQITGFATAFASAFAFTELTNVSSRFEDLRTSLQLLYKDAATGAAAFDDIKKFAASSIFSVEDLTQTVIKLKAAGLEPTVSLLRMFADTSSVAADSVGALQAITDLYARTTAGGLGLEDLNRLADRGIPVFTILSERLGLSRLEISKIGQTAEGARVILRALEDGLQDAFGGASEARAQNLSQAFSNLGDALSNTADAAGQAGLNAGLASLLKALTELVNLLRPVAELIGTVLGGAFKILGEYLQPVVAGMATFIAGLVIARVVAFTGAIFELGKAFLFVGATGPMKLVALIAAIVATLGATYTEIKKLLGKGDELTNSEGFKVLQDGKLGAGTEDLKAKVAALNQELNKFKVEMNAVVSSFARYNLNARQALELDTALLGTSRENQSLRRSEAEINKRLAEEIVKLNETKAKLTEEERKQGRGAIIDQTIKKLEAQAEADKKAMAATITASEAAQRADSLRLFGLKSQEETNRNIRKIQDDMAKMTLPEIQRIEYDIAAAARERAQSEIEAEQIRRGSLLTDAEKQAYLDRALQGTQLQIEQARELYAGSRSFNTGWSQAFNEYADNATNAADQARRVFQSMTSAMEEMLYNFFKNGRLGWRGFVQAIADTLLRSQIQQLVGKIMSPTVGVGGGRGLFGGAIIPGILAEGGPAAMNRPYIVGERGPELFVPSSNGTVIPNRDLAGGGQVVYNINAVDAASFKALVARDPSFIHAVAMQGAKTVPGRI